MATYLELHDVRNHVNSAPPSGVRSKIQAAIDALQDALEELP